MTKNVEKKKQILLTFDYELFLGGKSGTPQKCLLEPTEKLLTIFGKRGIKGTFFIDVLYYQRLLESDATLEDARRIKQQLQDIVARGSRIELHLHPHWLDAVYKSGEWQFPSYDRFRLQSLSRENITGLFAAGVQLLESIGKEVRADYKVRAFRAGGFCISPFTLLKPGFLSNGIIIDSSVASGIVAGESQTHRFDFRNAPNKESYRFNDDPTVAATEGLFHEFPIATFRREAFPFKYIRKIWSTISPKTFRPVGDGLGLSFPSPPLWKRFLPSLVMFSLDGELLPGELARQVGSASRKRITIISHPKSLSDISFLCLDRLLAEKHEFIGFDDAINAV